jgi:dihydroxy-acid dehydratase
MQELGSRIDGRAMTVTGKTMGENIAGAENFNPDVIRGMQNAIYPEGGCAVLKGNLAPRGAIMKPSAAEPRLRKHRGKAVVFRDYNHMAAEIDMDDLDVTADSVIVLQNAGPKGGPGMPEWGMLPIPKKLVRQGVRDMVRISDARMSGTSYGACILHVSPESFVGGALALVKTGDEIEVDVEKRRLHLHVSDAELEKRRKAWKALPPRYERGYGRMYQEHIGQADEGCDFDFLEQGAPVAEPEIH